MVAGKENYSQLLTMYNYNHQSNNNNNARIDHINMRNFDDDLTGFATEMDVRDRDARRLIYK